MSLSSASGKALTTNREGHLTLFLGQEEELHATVGVLNDGWLLRFSLEVIMNHVSEVFLGPM